MFEFLGNNIARKAALDILLDVQRILEGRTETSVTKAVDSGRLCITQSSLVNKLLISGPLSLGEGECVVEMTGSTMTYDNIFMNLTYFGEALVDIIFTANERAGKKSLVQMERTPAVSLGNDVDNFAHYIRKGLSSAIKLMSSEKVDASKTGGAAGSPNGAPAAISQATWDQVAKIARSRSNAAGSASQ